MAGEASEGQIGAFMMALRSKGETVEELSGLVDVMLENALLLETGSDAVDIVGTGGDLVGTVNISSMASIVASASGVPAYSNLSPLDHGRSMLLLPWHQLLSFRMLVFPPPYSR